MKLFFLFVVLNILNVIIQTIKSMITINGSKISASVWNAIAYGFYTIVLVYMSCELPLIQKALIVAAVNFIGVYVVKYFEEKMRKDKLWKVETNILFENTKAVEEFLKNAKISFNSFDTNDLNYKTFNIYCNTKKESETVKKVLEMYKAKYFVSESKTL